jgi:hypothetical protein
MLKYKNFIFENLINESKLVFSQKFKSLLQSMETTVSNKILGMESKDVDTAYNFIDISDNKDSVTFIPDKKAQELSKVRRGVTTGGGHYLSPRSSDLFKKYGFANPDQAQESIDEDTEVTIKDEFRHPRNNRMLYFVESDTGHKAIINVEHVNELENTDVWKKGRNAIKVGRLINNLYKIATNTELSSKDLEDFVNSYKSKWEVVNNDFLHFDVVSGDDIKYWYEQSHYKNQNGTLGNSCMKYDSCQQYLDIYTENPEVVRLIILYDKDGSIHDNKYTSNKIIGRALLWKLANRDVYYMDRIYTNSDSDMNLFEEFADKNGWIYYLRHKSGLSDKSKDEFLVKIKNKDYDYYPYMDTFYYYNGASKLTNDDSAFSDVTWRYSLDCTDGDKSKN